LERLIAIVMLFVGRGGSGGVGVGGCCNCGKVDVKRTVGEEMNNKTRKRRITIKKN
jgi:hypothetical protein